MHVIMYKVHANEFLVVQGETANLLSLVLYNIVLFYHLIHLSEQIYFPEHVNFKVITQLYIFG